MSDNNELNKLMLLKRAVDQLHSDELPEWEQDLMEGAWLILHDEPGTEREEWRHELIRQYPTEVVDTFGTNPPEAYAAMDDWWDYKEYEDPRTGINERYKDWAEIFANDKTVEIYETLAEILQKHRT